MIQQLIVVCVFIAAVIYSGWLIYKSFNTRSACATGCGKCNAVDFEKIEQELKRKGL